MSKNQDVREAVETHPANVDFKVQGALDRWALGPGGSDVKVGTKGNTVTLTGHVLTWAEHDAVVDAAWMTSGVHDVDDDDLTVTGL